MSERQSNYSAHFIGEHLQTPSKNNFAERTIRPRVVARKIRAKHAPKQGRAKEFIASF